MREQYEASSRIQQRVQAHGRVRVKHSDFLQEGKGRNSTSPEPQVRLTVVQRAVQPAEKKLQNQTTVATSIYPDLCVL